MTQDPDPSRPAGPGATPPPRPRISARAAAAVRASLAETARAAGGQVRRVWDRRPRGHRAAAVALCALLALAGALGLAFQTRLPARLPGTLEWSALATLLQGEGRPGDAVVVSPAWAERARRAAPAAMPVLALARYAEEDLLGVRRVWLVSLPGAPGFSWSVERDLLERATRNDPPLHLGPVEVTRYDLSLPRLPRTYLPDALGHGEVWLGETACPQDLAGAFRCPGPDGATAATVARTVREVGGGPRPCLALEGAGPLRLELPAMRLGRTLRGHAGAAGDPAAAAGLRLRVALRVDGEEAGEVEVAGAGWRPFELDTARFAGRAHAVALTIAHEGAPVPACLEAVALP